MQRLQVVQRIAWEEGSEQVVFGDSVLGLLRTHNEVRFLMGALPDCGVARSSWLITQRVEVYALEC